MCQIYLTAVSYKLTASYHKKKINSDRLCVRQQRVNHENSREMVTQELGIFEKG